MTDHRQIRVLPAHAAERIAAGEVVERPASVVKELIENSLDAGAHRINIEVEGAGSRLIRVIDDGEGIPAAELPVAFQRFATSKIRSAEDLHRIGTYGFRGEALPSIAAVARVEVVTQTREEGARIRVVGGSQEHPAPASRAPGTTVTVEDLFFNTPGRRKFIKSPAREMAVIAETVQALALAAPQVAFRLADAGRELFWYPPEDFAGRARRALGPDIARHAMDAGVDGPPVTLEGVIGTPQVAQRRRTHQWFLVNGRPVRSPLLARALLQAYHTLVPRDRYPAAVLALHLSPADVDANVHPRKAEVRFVHEGSIFNAVVAGIQRALHRVPLLHVVPATAGPSPAPAAVARGAMPLPFPSPHRGEAEGEWPPESPGGFEAPDPAGLTTARPWPAIRIVGQLARAYIVGEAHGDLVLVDQHAAHERVLYERLIDQRDREGVLAQGLVAPVVLDVDARELALLKEIGLELGAAGFEIEPFGPTGVRLVAVPTIAASRAPAELFRACLHDLAESPGRHAGRSLQERLVIATACHTAVRAGDALEPEAMASLLGELSRTRDPFSCFHGRPTMVRLPRSELERWFYRRP